GIAGSRFAGFGRDQMCPWMTYADIATPGGIERRLGGASGGPGYFNKSAFCAPPDIGNGTDYGNSWTGIILGPGQFNWDVAILKSEERRVGEEWMSMWALDHQQAIV